MKIKVQNTIKAPIETVWKCYTTPDDIMQWNAASEDWHTVSATVDLRPEGHFSSRMEAKDGSMGFDFAGTYTDVQLHQKIAYSFGERSAEVLFVERGDEVEISVSFDPENVYPHEQQRLGWQAILDNFKRHVEQHA